LRRQARLLAALLGCRQGRVSPPLARQQSWLARVVATHKTAAQTQLFKLSHTCTQSNKWMAMQQQLHNYTQPVTMAM
jgi:hypothetical protein